jgi:hypothetical protein
MAPQLKVHFTYPENVQLVASDQNSGFIHQPIYLTVPCTLVADKIQAGRSDSDGMEIQGTRPNNKNLNHDYKT